MNTQSVVPKPETRIAGRNEDPFPEQHSLHLLYHAFEDTLCVHFAEKGNPLKSLVTFDDCKTSPIHRWYTFKEGYSCNLLPKLQEWGIIPTGSRLRLLDPFCGVGTTVVSASHPDQASHYSFVAGVEINPTIRFVSQTKANWHRYDAEMIEGLIKRLESNIGRENRKFPVPDLSTFTAVKVDGRVAFDPEVIQDLLFYKEWISQIQQTEKDLLMLAWLSIVESVSYLRKDGRALRYVRKEKLPLQPPNVKEKLLAQLRKIQLDLSADKHVDNAATQSQEIEVFIMDGDARKLPFEDKSFDVVCYSPPYLNNIDYTEVYKMELWLKGDVETQIEFKNQRLKTMRSHPSIIFPSTKRHEEVEPNQWLSQLRAALMLAIPQDQSRASRERLFAGYIDDLLLSLSEQHRVAVSGAPIVCVVGNSLFGGENTRKVAVCTDLLVAAAAQAVGLNVEQIRVARQLPRRDNQNGWLRESIVVMRKP